MRKTIRRGYAVFIVLLLLLFSVSNSIALTEIPFEYDVNGNLITGKDYKYEYNGFNELSKVYKEGELLEEYFYDDNGIRIMKIEYKDGEKQTTFYPKKGYVRVVNSTGKYDTQYYHDNNGVLLGRKDSEGDKYYYHPDHLGSTSLITDENGEIAEETRYMPFGAVLKGGNDRFLYTGKEKDSTNLYYYGARYYDPNLRQFVQPDTIIPDVYDPQSLNKYSYVRNNPYKYVDPSGHFFDIAIDIGFIGWDIYNIWQEPLKLENWAALGGDVVGATVPFVTGLGTGMKTMFIGGKVIDKISEIDKVVDVVKTSDKVSDTIKLNKNAKKLKKGESVTVESFKEADKLLHETFPNAKKVKGASPVQKIATFDKFKAEEGIIKYKKEYLFNKETGNIYNHDQTGVHAFNPHINIKDGKKKVTIVIDKTIKWGNKRWN